MAFTLDDARTYIAKVRWQFAATMAQWPHEYTVLKWRQELEPEFFSLAPGLSHASLSPPLPRAGRLGVLDDG
jgi:hypothetical protein